MRSESSRDCLCSPREDQGGFCTPRPRPPGLKHTHAVWGLKDTLGRKADPYHKLCTIHALCIVVTAAAAGISSLQHIEGLTLATKVGVARLWQVPRAIHHMLTIRKADLV